MNERIAKLARQSGVYFGESGVLTKNMDLELFAELIVKECAKVCIKKYYYSDRMSKECGINFAKDIKEHFGVEE